MSSRWNEALHPRDEDGKFSDGGGGGSASSAPARSGGSRRKRLPETISSAEVKAKGGSITLDHYGDGSLGITTPGGTAKLSPDDRKKLASAFSDASDEMSPGDTVKVGATTLTREKSGFTFRAGDDSEGIAVSEANLYKMNDKSTDMSDYSKRVETGWGEADISIAPGNKLGMRILGDDGKPQNIELSSKQAQDLRSAIYSTFDGFDGNGDIDLPESGVLDKIDVKLGKGRSIHVEQQGHDNLDAKGHPQGNLMIEADDGSWGITVTPENYDAFTEALSDVVDAVW